MSATSIREVIEKLDALLARWESAGDYRAIFARSYRIITINMERAIAAGEFADRGWMTRLDIIFAEEYFTAVEAYDGGAGTLPDCWEMVFDIAVHKRGTTLQDLTLGMVAHIVHDLPIALYKAGITTDQRQRRLRDHETANDVLARLIDEVQQDISSQYSFLLGFLDRFSGITDEVLTDKGIRIARDRAWQRAVALTDAANETAREVLLRELAQTTINAVQFLAPQTPTLLAPLFTWLRRGDQVLARRARH